MSETVPLNAPPQLTPDRARQRRRRAFGRRFFFVLILLLVVGFSGLCGYFHTSPAGLISILGLGTDYVKAKFGAPPFNGRTKVNILVLGADVAFDGSGAARTDTIKFVSVDLKKPSIAVLSIPRDTWVDIPGHGHGRINSAYQFGGRDEADRMAMAKTVVSNLLSEVSGTEVRIHRYMRIQTGGFVKIVDALGGVDINVEKQMDYEDPSQRLYIHLKPGLQHLNGTQAMGYVRFRHDRDGDYGRIRRQDQFLHELVAQLNTPERKSSLPRLIGPIMSMMKTDLKGSDLLALKHTVDKIGMAGMQTLLLPTVATYEGKASVVKIEDEAAATQVVMDVLNGPRPTVAVVNATGRTGVARDVRAQIDATAFNVVGAGHTKTPVPVSQVIATEHCKTVATTLASQLGLASVSTTETAPAADFGKRPLPTPPEITIVLGADYTGTPIAESAAPLPPAHR